MQYCPKCHVLCETQCPSCGNRKLTQPQAEDPVRLVLANETQADMMETLLQQGGVPYEKRPAVSAGEASQRAYNFYVPCCRLQDGLDVKEVVFPQPEPETVPDDVPQESKPQTYRVGGEEFEVLPRKKRIFWRAFSVVLFILLMALVIFLTDSAAGWVKTLFGGH